MAGAAYLPPAALLMTGALWYGENSTQYSTPGDWGALNPNQPTAPNPSPQLTTGGGGGGYLGSSGQNIGGYGTPGQAGRNGNSPLDQSGTGGYTGGAPSGDTSGAQGQGGIGSGPLPPGSCVEECIGIPGSPGHQLFRSGLLPRYTDANTAVRFDHIN